MATSADQPGAVRLGRGGKRARRWRPRRLALRVVVALVLGMMTTHAVAWGILAVGLKWTSRGSLPPMRASAGPLTVSDASYRLDGDGGERQVLVWGSSSPIAALWCMQAVWPPRPGEEVAPSLEARAHLPEWVVDTFDKGLLSPSGVTYIYALGWPWVTHWIHLATIARPLDVTGLMDGAWSLSGVVRTVAAPVLGDTLRGSKHSAEVPPQIIWPNFLAATALWAAVWFGLMTLPSMAVRARRRRRGVCVRCRYSRVGLAQEAPCPECGLAEGSAGERGALAKPGTAH